MPAQYITVGQLMNSMPTASCCDCSEEAASAPEEEIWTIWNKTHIYCPGCAKDENIGPDD